MTEEYIKAIQDSIEHWQRMIIWAEEQPEDIHPNSSDMRRKLGEDWYCNSCALCKIAKDENGVIFCDKCPLAIKYGNCGESRNNPWLDIVEAKTWSEWVIYAEDMLDKLKSLLREK